MKLAKSAILLAASALALTACGDDLGTVESRDTIRSVGSSTVFPFAKAVSESLARSNPELPAVVIESTGTGGGMKLFCSGEGLDTPSATNASRRMKGSEFADCQENGVAEVIEMQVGLDGIAFASAQGGIELNLTPKIVYEALAAAPYGGEQTTKTWADVDPSLPALPILVYGPPTTSGTRDALKELILEVGCESNPEMEALKEQDEDKYDQVCTEVRADGLYVDQGEQDNLIVQKIEGNENAVGVFGYSYLEENADKVQGLPMNGVDPTYENIAGFQYPGARPLYVYVKKAHIGQVNGLAEYLTEWTKMWERGGPLAGIGLVASPDDVMAANLSAATEYTTLDGSELK